MPQTRNKNRLIRRGIIALALLAALPGTPVAAEQTFDEAAAAYRRGDYATAMRGFRILAEQGHAEAQADLGLMYVRGEGVPQDYQAALKWYRKAAEQGHADAQHTLGIMYTYGTVGIHPSGLVFRVKGDNVLRDYQEAMKWFRRAASVQGRVDCCSTACFRTPYKSIRCRTVGSWEGVRGPTTTCSVWSKQVDTPFWPISIRFSRPGAVRAASSRAEKSA